MLNLIAKDLYLQRASLTLVAILAGVAMWVMFTGTELGKGQYVVLLVFTFAVTYTFTFNSCFHEDKNKSMSFLRSLPVPARTVVNSKFAAMIMLVAALLILLFVAISLGKMAGIATFSAFSTDFRFFVLAGLAALPFNSIMLLIYFRWGYNRIQMVYAISFFVIFFGSMLLGRFIPKVSLFLPGISPWQGALLGAVPVLLLVFLCWKGSISGLSKKDLI
jgi:ABC-type transport system involved in multi-copper enzyme maturation permease subunit